MRHVLVRRLTIATLGLLTTASVVFAAVRS
jgi:hypothetical protein